eukprot:6692341-Karenia_brevis.AAC.2
MAQGGTREGPGMAQGGPKVDPREGPGSPSEPQRSPGKLREAQGGTTPSNNTLFPKTVPSKGADM